MKEQEQQNDLISKGIKTRKQSIFIDKIIINQMDVSLLKREKAKNIEPAVMHTLDKRK